MGDHEVPAVVGVQSAGNVDLWTAEEQEDHDSDDEPARSEDDQPDGADRRQFQPRHDETSTEAAQCSGQRPRQRCQSTNQSVISYHYSRRSNEA